MKLNKIYILPLLFLLLMSCRKDKEQLLDGSSVQDVYLHIHVKGFADAEDVAIDQPLVKNASIYHSDLSNQNDRMSLNNSSFAEVSFGQSNVHSNLRLSANANPAAVSAIGNVTPMAAGTKYMVLVFDENDIHQSTTLVTLGNKDLIYIPKPDNLTASTLIRTYKIVAFSYNTSQESDFASSLISLLPENSRNDPKIDIALDKQFLYVSFNHKIDFSSESLSDQPSSPVSLLFQEQRSKIGFIVDGKSMFSKVKSVKGTLGGFVTQTGVMNLKSNTITDLTNDYQQSMDFDYADLSQDTVGIYRYTVVPKEGLAVSNFNVHITKLELHRENVDKILVGASSPREFKLPSFTLGQGIQSVARIYLFEGFQVGDGAAAKLWSLANLYLDKDATDGQKFKIRMNAYDGMRNPDDYFRFFRLNPISVDDRASATSGTSGDPCSQLYPYDTWRLPNNADIDEFITQSANYSLVVYDAKDEDPLGDRYDYIDYTNKGKSIRFYTLGRKELGLYTYEGIRAEYWSSQDRILRFLSLVSGGDAHANNAPTVGAGLALNVRCIRAK